MFFALLSKCGFCQEDIPDNDCLHDAGTGAYFHKKAGCLGKYKKNQRKKETSGSNGRRQKRRFYLPAKYG